MALINSTPQAYYQGNDFGGYQFVSLKDIINQFMLVYVGEDKIIPKAKRLDVAFHAQRALAELSFDTLKSFKAQEITVPASLQMILPQDYVNYTKISWVDSAGIKHLLYPTSKTSNPTNYWQNTDGEFIVSMLAQTYAASNAIDLSGEPGSGKNLEVGMRVSGSPLIPQPAFITHLDVSASGATIEIGDDPDHNIAVNVIPLAVTNNLKLTFTRYDGTNPRPNDEGVQLFPVKYTLLDGVIEVDTSVTDASWDKLKVGMLVQHRHFPIGTTVTNVMKAANSIVLSNPPSVAVATYSEQMDFVFPEHLDSETWSSYKSGTPSENQDDYQDDTYWPMNGSRYGLDPQHAQANGSFYIDQITGKIHFSSNISGKTVILDYISDSLGTDGEMQVHKFAEEAMYKCISHAILSGKANIPEYQVNRLKKERFAAIRTAKLRLSNIKLEELTQILRGKSKQIKH
jgi:hypothetical protein